MVNPMNLNLYFISACDPTDPSDDLSLHVNAKSPQDAIMFWQRYYDLGPDEETENQMFWSTPMFPPDFPEIALRSDYLEMARVWQVNPSNVSGRTPLQLVGYVAP